LKITKNAASVDSALGARYGKNERENTSKINMNVLLCQINKRDIGNFLKDLLLILINSKISSRTVIWIIISSITFYFGF
jgi:hypothetical protein